MAGLAAVVLEVLLFTWARSQGWPLEWSVPMAFAGAAATFFAIRTAGSGRPPVAVFLAVAGLSYFLKVGFLAGLLELAGASEIPASIVAALAGWALVAASLQWLGRSATRSFGWRSGLSWRLVLALVAYSVVLRLLYLAFKERFHEHRRLARWTFPVWLYVSVTGIVVYLMLYRIYGFV